MYYANKSPGIQKLLQRINLYDIERITEIPSSHKMTMYRATVPKEENNPRRSDLKGPQ